MDDEKKMSLADELERVKQEAAQKEEEYVEIIKSLRKENADRRVKAKELDTQIADLSAKIAGIDMDKYEEAMKALRDAEGEKAKKEGDVDKIRQQILADAEKEKQAIAAERDAFSGKLSHVEGAMNKMMLGYEVALVSAVSKCLNPQLLELQLAQEAVVEVEDDGRRVVKLKDASGELRIDAKTGKPFTIKQRIEEMKQDPQFAMLFEGGSYGAGSRTTPNGAKVATNPWKDGPGFNLTEQGRILREQPDLAKRLAAEAGKTIMKI